MELSLEQLEKQPVIVITGPTATGKTALGVELAQWLDTEVISADSQVVYRHLDIGTAKPTEEEQCGIPHHMIDVAEPDEDYSVATYREAAEKILESLHERGKVPIVVGGTGFYIRALVEAGFFPDIPPNPAFRERMNALASQTGSPALHEQLAQVDPRRAAQLHPNDQFRIVRALEIIETTGQPVPDINTPKPYQLIWLGLKYEDRDLLRQRIDERIDAMLTAGWLDEVRDLMQRFGPHAHALNVAHGYPEWVRHLQDNLSFEEALGQVQINIHQYARRQLTWNRRNPEILSFDRDRQAFDEIIAMARNHIRACLEK